MDDELDRQLEAMDCRMELGAASREVAYTWGGEGCSLRAFRDGLEAAHHRRDIDLWRVHSLNASIALAEGRTDDARGLAGRALDAGREAWNDTAHAIHIYVRVTARPPATGHRPPTMGHGHRPLGRIISSDG